jgi:phosphate transport system protein
MIKEFLSLFRSHDAIAQMGEDFQKMLAATEDLTLRAGRIFWNETDGPDEPREIAKRDVAINQLAHLTLSSGHRDVPYCLLLMSIVKDVERIGDYAKNLAEVQRDGGAPVPHDDIGNELKELRRIVEEAFGKTSQIFRDSDSTAAAGLMTQLRSVIRRCDELIPRVTESDYNAATTTSVVLGARYYKRIGAHVLNVLSGTVMPLHKLDYYDEDQLPTDDAAGEEE